MMGRGKTSAAINMINSDRGKRYVFITPYLSEVTRIKNGCRGFCEPIDSDGIRKLDSFKALIKDGCDVVTTHALFKILDEEATVLLSKGSYTLIIDEALECIEEVDITPYDFNNIIKNYTTYTEEGLVYWRDDEYQGKYEIYKNMCVLGDIYKYGNRLYRLTPKRLFDVFSDIYVLTYMFKGSIFEKYLEMQGYEYIMLHTMFDNGKYYFTDKSSGHKKDDLYNLINIVDNPKMNSIGKYEAGYDRHKLTKSWYQNRATDEDFEAIKRHLHNFYRRMCKSQSKDNIWTTFKDYKTKLKGVGYTKGFISLNIRATNEYKDKTNVAFLVNIFINPNIRNIMYKNGVGMEDDDYALSILVQFIWRSAIRDGKAINLYIPSLRMRTLLMGWINENTSGSERYDIESERRKYKMLNLKKRNKKEVCNYE